MCCNAWNHPANCDCGWGGDTSYAPRSYHPPHHHHHHVHAALANGKYWREAKHAVPNARCPICGAPVFYIEPESGGRVFFDELGPPWPKHPCTDNSGSFAHRKEFPTFEQPARNVAEKPLQGWRLLSNWRVKRLDDYVVVSGRCDEHGGLLRFRTCLPTDVVIEGPVLLRKSDFAACFDAECVGSRKAGGVPSIFTQSLVLFPITGGGDVNTWKDAVSGDGAAASLLGWNYSFRWHLMKNAPDLKKYINWDVAFSWFSRGDRSGNTNATNNLGVMYLHGLGRPVNHEKAFEHFARAAISLDETPLRHLSECFEQGLGCKADQHLAKLFAAMAKRMSTPSLPEPDPEQEEIKRFCLGDILKAAQTAYHIHNDSVNADLLYSVLHTHWNQRSLWCWLSAEILQKAWKYLDFSSEAAMASRRALYRKIYGA